MCKQLIAPVAVGLASVMIGVGCGGSTDSLATASLAKAEFVKKANVICSTTQSRLDTRLQAYLRDISSGQRKKPPSEAATQVAVAKIILIPTKEEEIEEFEELGAPEGEVAQVEAFLASLEEGISKAEEHPEEAVATSRAMFRKSRELAVKNGLYEEC